MIPFLISFGTITTISAFIWLVYVFFRHDILTYIGFNSIRRRAFRRKLKDKNYMGDNSVGTDKSTGSPTEGGLVGNETVLLNQSDETILLTGSDETTLL